MFEYTINTFESLLVTVVLYNLCRRKRTERIKYFIAFCFFLFQFSFITGINHFSMTESVFEFIELLVSFTYVSLISTDSVAYKFFICAIPYNVIGIENTIQNTTVSYILFHKIDYYLLAERYRIINVLISQLIHVVLFYFIIRIVNRIELTIKDRDYYLLGFIFYICNFMTICFETLGYHFENQDLFMLLGIYSIVMFIILIVYLFVSIYRHSTTETKQQIELDILRSQQASSRKLLDAQSDLYQLRHDMKHFIQALKNPDIIQSPNTINNMISQYEELVKNVPVPITTLSPAINHVLNIKREEAIRKGIDFAVSLNITHDIDMEDSDLYLLISNLLDNAVEHIGMLKHIRVEMSDVGKMFRIKISNSIDHPVLDEKGNFISTGKDPEHGYGIKTVEDIISRYNGYIAYNDENGELMVSIMIN